MPITEAQQIDIETQIREGSIPYDYDTKEYPIEVINLKFNPRPGEPATMFIPNYQRALVWDNKRQVKFIESLFLGVPVPPIFVAIRDEDGTLEIIDGSQRIRTISRYLHNELLLEDLEELDSLNKTRFSDLSPSRQRKFANIVVRFHVVTENADLAVRADIFDRLNSNVKVLVPSEIRKGAFADVAYYQFILEMAHSQDFRRLLPQQVKVDEQEELALRFFAYAEAYQEFRHDVAKFLNRFVERKARDGFDRGTSERNFFEVLNFVRNHFPNHFAKSQVATLVPRVRFEAIAVGVYLAIQEVPGLNAPGFMAWLQSKEFKALTTSDASNSRTKLARRVEFVRDCILGRIQETTLHY